MKLQSFIFIGLICFAAPAPAALIGYTSFEELITPVDGTGQPIASYTDPGNPAVDHELANAAGNSPVQYTSTGGELGFRSFYANTRNSTGLTGGFPFGVTARANANLLAPPDGTKRFINGGTNGRATVVLDSVNLAGTIAPKVSLQAWFESTTYEWVAGGEMDYFRIWVELNDGVNTTNVTLLDTRPNDIDGLSIEGGPTTGGPSSHWNTYTASLLPNTIATLKFEVDDNNAAEAMGIDDVRFTDVPEPSSFVLGLFAALLTFACKLRRRG